MSKLTIITLDTCAVTKVLFSNMECICEKIQQLCDNENFCMELNIVKRNSTLPYYSEYSLKLLDDFKNTSFNINSVPWFPLMLHQPNLTFDPRMIFIYDGVWKDGHIIKNSIPSGLLNVNNIYPWISYCNKKKIPKKTIEKNISKDSIQYDLIVSGGKNTIEINDDLKILVTGGQPTINIISGSAHITVTNGTPLINVRDGNPIIDNIGGFPDIKLRGGNANVKYLVNKTTKDPQ